jgi:hypothetical protein
VSCGTYLVVGGVDQDLIEDLEETWNKGCITAVSGVLESPNPLANATHRFTIIFVASS